MNQVSEIKLFSKYSENKAWNNMLVKSSRSVKDAEQRKNTYRKVFNRYNDLKETTKMFSGLSEMGLMTNQYFNATMASYVRSFAGYLAIERDMDQPDAMLYFMDVLGVLDNRIVLPNVGHENLSNINSRLSTAIALVVGDATYELSTGKKLIPGTVTITLKKAVGGATYTIKDDRQGNLLAPAGILAAGTVDYTSAGTISFELGAGFTIAANDTCTVTAFEDVAGNPEFNGTASGNNRFKLDMKHISVRTEADLLIGESNLMQLAQMQKSLGINPQEILAAKLTELYTKLINSKLVGSITNYYEGTTFEIPVTENETSFDDYNSRLDAFNGAMVDINSVLAKKSAKGVKATAYVVGTNTANYFSKLANTGLFTENQDQNNVNDLLGFYKGTIPVLQSTDVNENEGYAIHKTADGQLAPSIRGIYLPLTNTPVVGNYQNPTQVASGVYYQEANESIVPELIQKFKIV